MDPNQILNLLNFTLGTSDVERKTAEIHLKEAEKTPGYAISLLKIVGSNQIEISLRQSAAIYLKQLVRDHWTSCSVTPTFVLAEEDKSILKANIVEILICSPKRIRDQISLCLRDMVEEDYPEKWNDLLPKILSYITSNNPSAMEGALEALRVTIKRYEFTQPGKSRRKPLQQLVESTFPLLLELFSSLIGTNEVQAAIMLKTIIKMFWSSINFGIPPYILNDQNLSSWMKALFSLFRKPIPTEIIPKDIDDQAKHPWWKCKKWIANIFSRMFQRFTVS